MRRTTGALVAVLIVGVLVILAAPVVARLVVLMQSIGRTP